MTVLSSDCRARKAQLVYRLCALLYELDPVRYRQYGQNPIRYIYGIHGRTEHVLFPNGQAFDVTGADLMTIMGEIAKAHDEINRGDDNNSGRRTYRIHD